MLRRDNLTLLLSVILAGILLVLKPGEVPPPWFDEGWLFSLARNWVELGHYGHLLMGEPVPATQLTTGFPAVAPVALSFRLFGIGAWQGRLPGMFFTVGALGALYYLARRLYDRSVAVGTLGVALLLSWNPALHPVLLGRQALGEMPALFFLLVGFAFFSWAWKRPLWSMPLAVLCWALSLLTKPQVLPFFLAALLLPLAIALWKRRWRTARILAFGLLGAGAAAGVLAGAQELLFSSPLFSDSSGNDIYSFAREASGRRTLQWLVLVPAPRLTSLLTVVLFSMPLVLGLCYTAWNFVGDVHSMDLDSEQQVGRLILWTFAASWLSWYLLFSIGYYRYLFPAAFVGSVFVALTLRDVAGGFDPAGLVKRGAEILKQRRFTIPGMGILLAAIVIPAMCLATVIMLCASYIEFSDEPLSQAVHFLNTYTEPDALIETYDSELFFLLDRPFHYPPISVQHELNRRTFLFQNNVIHYDPLEANPDYLVVGPYSELWKLYEPVLAAGAFRLLQTYGVYDIYERVP